MSNFAGKLSTVSVLTTAPSTYTAVPGLTAKSISYSGQTIDVTDSESTDLFQQLLSGGGVKSFSISFSGKLEASAALNKLKDTMLDGALNTYRFLIAGFGTIEGSFALVSADFSNPHADAIEYSFQLASSGKPTFTAV